MRKPKFERLQRHLKADYARDLRRLQSTASHAPETAELLRRAYWAVNRQARSLEEEARRIARGE